MAEIKPCPFCGGGARIARESDSDGFGTYYTMQCVRCGAETAPRYASHGNDCPNFYAEVRDLWNRRTSIGDTPAPQSKDDNGCDYAERCAFPRCLDGGCHKAVTSGVGEKQ